MRRPARRAVCRSVAMQLMWPRLLGTGRNLVQGVVGRAVIETNDGGGSSVPLGFLAFVLAFGLQLAGGPGKLLGSTAG